MGPRSGRSGRLRVWRGRGGAGQTGPDWVSRAATASRCGAGSMAALFYPGPQLQLYCYHRLISLHITSTLWAEGQ